MRFYGWSLLWLFFSSLCFSQVKQKDTVLTQELSEVIITATRTERQLSSLPLPALLVPKKEIVQTNRTRLNSILNEQTGLITVQNFIGGEGIQMQGLDSDYTLILIDGVPLIGRSAGTLDLSRLSVGDIKQIEIVKGASSSLYGSEALGGVINIITDKAKTRGIHSVFNTRLATYNASESNLNLDYKNDKVALSLFGNASRSDGYDLPNSISINTLDPYWSFTINPSATYNFNDSTNVYGSFRFFKQSQDYIPTNTQAGKIDSEEWNVHIKSNHEYNSKWSSYFEFYASRYNASDYLNDITTNTLSSESYYKESLIRPEIRATFKPNNKSEFIGGLGMDYETLDRSDFRELPKFTSPYVYLQYDTNLWENLNVILGARFDKHSEYKSQFSPKAALRYKINDKLAIKGSIGYGFKAPDFRQLYFDLQGIGGYTVLGFNVVTSRIQEMLANGEIEDESDVIVPLSIYDGELKPENSVGYNIGISYSPISSVKFDINFFRNDINDLIDTQLIAYKSNGSSVFSYNNINKAFTQGLEFNGSWSVSNELKVSGGYQLLFAKDKDAVKAFEDGNVFANIDGSGAVRLDKEDYFGLLNRSKHMANLKFFYTNTKYGFNTNLRGTYRSKYGLFDTNGNLYLDKYDDFIEAYTLWNWAFNKTVSEHFEIGVGIDNIFDFTDAPENTNDLVFITNIPGRILYANLNIKF